MKLFNYERMDVIAPPLPCMSLLPFKKKHQKTTLQQKYPSVRRVTIYTKNHLVYTYTDIPTLYYYHYYNYIQSSIYFIQYL